MKLILKDGLAFFNGEGYIPKKPLRVTIELKDAVQEDCTFLVKLNNAPYRSAKKTFTIDVEYLEKGQLQVEVVVKHRDGKKATYKTDPILLQSAVLFGRNLENQFPASLYVMRQELKEMKKITRQTAQAVIEIGKRGEIV